MTVYDSTSVHTARLASIAPRATGGGDSPSCPQLLLDAGSECSKVRSDLIDCQILWSLYFKHFLACFRSCNDEILIDESGNLFSLPNYVRRHSRESTLVRLTSSL